MQLQLLSQRHLESDFLTRTLVEIVFGVRSTTEEAVFRYPGTQTNVINVGSYNYLGFAQTSGPCADAAIAQIDSEGLATCTTVHERGRSVSQYKLEKLVAEFLHVEDAIVFSMGFATNSMNAPCLVDKHSLIISDQHNHASLILGCRLSGASTKVFKHNG
ncbi:hypothetical protein COOONC_14243 [Cooperia oncophora]